MQVAFFRYDKYMVGPDVKFLCYKVNRHIRKARKNLMKLGGYRSQMINDDDSNTHICRKIPQ